MNSCEENLPGGCWYPAEGITNAKETGGGVSLVLRLMLGNSDTFYKDMAIASPLMTCNPALRQSACATTLIGLLCAV